MQFTVVEQGGRQPKGGRSRALLVRDGWNDFGFITMFHLVIYDEDGRRHGIGEVKIGELGMHPGLERSPEGPGRIVRVPAQFAALGERHFSVGQDDSYYERLRQLGDVVRTSVLRALNDIAFDGTIFGRVEHEKVTRESLMRFLKPSAVEEQFRRIAQGGVRVSGFEVAYEAPTPAGNGGKSVTLPFDVFPSSRPSTNIHVLIGRNSVGKSYLLNSLTRCVGDYQADPREVGRIIESDRGARSSFANLVSVTFSAFDEFPLLRDDSVAISYAYVGLKIPSAGRTPRVKTPGQLKKDFADSVEACLTGERADRWAKSLRTLQYSGSGFLDEVWLEDFKSTRSANTRRRKARQLFAGLSSGHKIVLLTMTRLVEHVTERSLVVLDEPESHLHPPLLAAFIRALSDLLTERNGLAVIATHSPVVLQEVPASCVWKLRRNGVHLVADRPTIQTFGENVGVLTHEIFGLEVTDSGFHRDLKSAVRRGLSYERILERFGGQLGGEAKAIVRSLIAVRASGEPLGEEGRL
ncbi:AAA family ATPase [Actinacidiphila sp. ITFR-21]|uniref:AAA family ATPase n=1 Tax=Actinacidiphila sp. ITFR-21 TaxID=3075199 RepID=UPI00288B3CB9|nr:AAA family ATPase [Streptomyces sp. ITFR-21]WNI16213.1 AAA family ATPase [Streptomyces sp. ITFR-21]